MNVRSKLMRVVLGHFMLNPEGEVFGNELAQRYGLDSGNLSRLLIRLEQDGFLKSHWQGGQRHYSLNAAFPLIDEYRAIFQKTFGLEEVLREALKGVTGISRAVIFGSCASGHMDVHSDIDLLVVGDHATSELNRAIAAVQKKIDRPIHAVTLTPDEYKARRTKDAFLKSVERSEQVVIL